VPSIGPAAPSWPKSVGKERRGGDIYQVGERRRQSLAKRPHHLLVVDAVSKGAVYIAGQPPNSPNNHPNG
jgi:hypothetical protein